MCALGACGPAFDPVGLRVSTLSRDASGVTLRDETSGVSFTVGVEPTRGEVQRRGTIRHLRVDAVPAGAARGQIVDVVSSPEAPTDPREHVETLVAVAQERGHLASRAARFHHGHPAMLLTLDEVHGADGHVARVLVVSDGRVAAMLTDVVPAAAPEGTSQRFFDALRLPGD